MLEMLIGAAIFGAGLVTGRLLPGRRRGANESRPICSCGHAMSFHGQDGRCNATREVSRWNGPRWAGNVQEQCRCQKYTGPQPLPSFYAPEITD